MNHDDIGLDWLLGKSDLPSDRCDIVYSAKERMVNTLRSLRTSSNLTLDFGDYVQQPTERLFVASGFDRLPKL